MTSFYRERCAGCHGDQGAGDGAAAASLTPKPRSFRDGAWQRAIDDDKIRLVILRGGQSAGKSVLMPANPDLERRPAMLDALVKHVRAFETIQ